MNLARLKFIIIIIIIKRKKHETADLNQPIPLIGNNHLLKERKLWWVWPQVY